MTLDAAQIAALLEGTTPGPWAHELLMHSDPNGDEYASDVEVSVGRVHIHGHDLGYDDGPVDEAIKANARLIAAAPDLARTALDAIAAREAAERERDALSEALRKCLNYLENTEGEFGITLSSADAARTALEAIAAQEAAERELREVTSNSLRLLELVSDECNNVKDERDTLAAEVEALRKRLDEAREAGPGGVKVLNFALSGDTGGKQRLYQLGDVQRIWVNQGDLIALQLAGVAIRAQGDDA